jgi:hypothetical protein
MTPLEDEADDLKRPNNDHDLLIRLHERIIALQQQIQAFIQSQSGLIVRVEKLEAAQASLSGEKTIYIWVRNFFSSIVGGIIVGAVLYFTR